jgi:enoyl-CoA hydratase
MGFVWRGGLELAMACTLRIASEKARLGLPELGLGIITGYGGTQRLARLAGREKAAEMILTAKPIDTQEAFRIGLVNQVVSSAELIRIHSHSVDHGSYSLRYGYVLG